MGLYFYYAHKEKLMAKSFPHEQLSRQRKTSGSYAGGLLFFW